MLIELNELGKRDKIRGLSNMSSLYRNEFNKYNSTNVRLFLSYDIKILFEISFLP